MVLRSILILELISIFLFFNEVFSFVMRIFSLSGRLALNMFSGHMLLFLITNVSFHLLNHFGLRHAYCITISSFHSYS